MALPPSRASGPYRPTRLGQWEVVAKIAGGGMSAVYLGRHVDSPPEAPNVVALKIARHDSSMDDRLVKMFLEEGKLIQKLVHPNIVRTLEVGADKEQDFIAMELMLGKTFAAVHDTIAARGGRMSPDIAAWCAARVADALHFAHDLTDETGRALNLVHRDVNPANIFATFKGEVKLFDFGLAKVTTGDTSSSQQMLAGKLSYLSPEQVMQIPVDRRSDIFSLGTTLWEFLTGKRLFRRDSDIDTVRAVQLGPIPDIRTIAPDLPEELARITKVALERNRDHRYPSGAYLARDLDNWLFQRSTPTEVTARLAQLIDTIFPGEQKRQGGWLKPTITSTAQQKSNLAATALSAGVSPRPERPQIEVRRDSRETTAVMHNAPIHIPRDGGSTTSAVAPIDTPLPTSAPLTPGPLTPRDGIPSIVATPAAPSVAPSTPRFGSGASVPPPSSSSGAQARASWPVAQRPASMPPPAARARPAPRAPIETPPPMSRTAIGVPAAVIPTPMPTPAPRSVKSPTAPPPSGRPLPAFASEPPTDVKSDPPTDVTTAPGLPIESLDLESTIISTSHSFPPPPKTPSFAPIEKIEKRASVPPPAAITPKAAPIPGKVKPSLPPPAPTPGPAAAGSPVFPKTSAIGQARPKRAPIPLPSRVPLPSKSVAPPARTSIVPPAPAPAAIPQPSPQPTQKRTDTKPPDSSKTQIDVPAPERKR